MKKVFQLLLHHFFKAEQMAVKVRSLDQVVKEKAKKGSCISQCIEYLDRARQVLKMKVLGV